MIANEILDLISRINEDGPYRGGTLKYGLAGAALGTLAGGPLTGAAVGGAIGAAVGTARRLATNATYNRKNRDELRRTYIDGTRKQRRLVRRELRRRRRAESDYARDIEED